MSNPFFEKPIVNSPYTYPAKHWELDESGQPTQNLINKRRRADFVTPIPKPKRISKQSQANLDIASDASVADDQSKYIHAELINNVRHAVDNWRALPEAQWKVTPETARLLKHWRGDHFNGIRPFFCQVEAAETIIWLTEVAPKSGKLGRAFIEDLNAANEGANPGLSRLALKLATGAGKTTVMAMLIAWQTINAVRRPNSKQFTKGFLIVAPGITIRDRLRVLLPNDTHSYYRTRQLVPDDMMQDINQAKVVISNYHGFKLREKMELSSGGRKLLTGRGEELNTLETEGQMIQRVIPELMAMKNIMVINDEAHHCYRERPADESEEDKLKGDERELAKDNAEAARLWINGIEAIKRKLGVARVVDLSATPFFLSGSGYVEGTLFPWTMSDFSLMDAIECGIVKLPRVPVADNLVKTGGMPMYRDLWEHIGKDMPKKGRVKGVDLDPESLPLPLKTALDALYGHYDATAQVWEQAGETVPPCFIVVCNNTAASKLVYDYISGWHQQHKDGSSELQAGRLERFRNFDHNGSPYARPRTLLIDSQQLESGELDDNFRTAASDEIERFKKEIIQRTGSRDAADKLSDADLLREVMNTVGKEGTLGEGIRCVVSVSMLTEGWDANNVTHVLGVRAFGTQLLCEQVIGRALRRQSYELNDEGLFNVEYADVLGIPFDFNAEPVISKPQKPRETTSVKAINANNGTATDTGREALEIHFPRVTGYRVELGEERLSATFTDDHTLRLTPDLIGATETRNEGIIGEGIDLNLVKTDGVRKSSIIYHLTHHLLYNQWREPGHPPKLQYFGQLKRIVKQWMANHLECRGSTYPAQLMYRQIANSACDRIIDGINEASREAGTGKIHAILDAYNPSGSTYFVAFNTSKTELWTTDSRKCHINYVVLDSEWEGEFCRIAEQHPKVLAYVKNHSLGFEVPYQYQGEQRRYRPDFIVQVDDGHGPDDPLNLVVEVKGYRGEDVKDKSNTMKTQWVPGVNSLGDYGRWAFAEFGDVYAMQSDFSTEVERLFNELLEGIDTGTKTG